MRRCYTYTEGALEKVLYIYRRCRTYRVDTEGVITEWNTPLDKVLTVPTVVNLARAHHTAGTLTSRHMDLTEDAEDTDNTGQ